MDASTTPWLTYAYNLYLPSLKPSTHVIHRKAKLYIESNLGQQKSWINTCSHYFLVRNFMWAQTEGKLGSTVVFKNYFQKVFWIFLDNNDFLRLFAGC